MADLLLSEVLNGEIDHAIITCAMAKNLPIPFKESFVDLSEFIPYFLTFLRDHVTPVLDTRAVYYSPRQLQEQKKTQRVGKKHEANNSGKRSARISLKYASSPTNTTFSDSSTNDINEISPIKKTTSIRKKKNRTSPANKDNMLPTPVFELSSLDDFPSILTNPNKNPRRITATPVTVGKASFNTSRDNMSENVFLLEESSFETQNADHSFGQLFIDDKRFSKKCTNDFGDSFDVATNGFHCSFTTDDCMMTSKTPTKETLEVTDEVLLNVLVDIYSCICLHNLIPNLTLELYFLFTTLTCPTNGQLKNQMPPFLNVECCIYFAAKCLENLSQLLTLLDIKSIQLLHENIRLRKYIDPACLDCIQSAITNEYENTKESFTVKSPMTGIPFQVESDNRKSFLSDRHFYSFSKKRDGFYVLVREWQENYLDTDWHLKSFLRLKVPELLKSNDSINTHYPFARLFVAQLLDMCRNSVGSEADEPNTSDSFLLELKKCNPAKFQSLHDRLTRPSASHDLCPKPSFSKVEEFFKEFIFIADGYCFSKFLLHVLLSHIMQIDSNSFGLDAQINNQLNKSDFADSLWQDIKVAIAELRLLSKFLSYVTFLPYISEKYEDALLKCRHLVSEPLHIYSYLRTSYQKKRLLITIPWVVDFLSMADNQSFELEEYKKCLHFLVCLLRDMKISHTNFSLLKFSLTLHIGWLLELPHVQSRKFYAVVSDHVESKEVGIDDIVTVDKAFLYTLCPYLNDIKKPLADFSKGIGGSFTGSFRKITPVRTSDAFSVDIKSSLKIQLLDHFMKYLPTHVKDCMKFVTERHFMNIKHHISTSIITSQCHRVVDRIKEVFTTCNEQEEVTPENLKLKNHSIFTQCTEDGRIEVETKSDVYLKNYLNEKIGASLQSLLPDSTHGKILEVSTKVMKHNIRLKVQEWMTTNRELYTSGVEAAYNRHVMSVMKTSNRAKSISEQESFSRMEVK